MWVDFRGCGGGLAGRVSEATALLKGANFDALPYGSLATAVSGGLADWKSSSWNGFLARRSRQDPTNKRFPVGSKIMH